MSEAIHDAQRLKELQALPLERKIMITQARIIEFNNWAKGNIYVSVSGGKDSTVLADIVRKINPDAPLVFANTGLEYPENQKLAKEMGAVFVRPKMQFSEVISTYGYPVIGKEVAEAIYYARRIKPVERERENCRAEASRTAWEENRSEREQNSAVCGKQSEWERLEIRGGRLPGSRAEVRCSISRHRERETAEQASQDGSG